MIDPNNRMMSSTILGVSTSKSQILGNLTASAAIQKSTVSELDVTKIDPN